MMSHALIKAFEELAPLSLAEEWDNCGLLIGLKDKEINRVYIALDATDDVVTDAIEKEVDLLLTHHPLIFKSLKTITEKEFVGRRLIQLIQNEVNYYSMHTNFDVAVMADLAADYLRLSQKEVLEKTDEVHGSGKIGLLPSEMELQELCEYVKKVFSLEHVKVFGNTNKKLQKVAIMPGSGKSYIKNAVRSQVDVMITGDIDHHDGIDGVAQGLVIIDAGHYGIEHIFVEYMKQFIEDRFVGIKVYTEKTKNPFQFM